MDPQSRYAHRCDACAHVAPARNDQQPDKDRFAANAVARPGRVGRWRLDVGHKAPVSGPTRFARREIAKALTDAGSIERLITDAAARPILPALSQFPTHDVAAQPRDDGRAGVAAEASNCPDGAIRSRSAGRVSTTGLA